MKVTNDPFSDLAIYRQKLEDDLDHPPPGSGPDFPLLTLLEQEKDVEQAIFGELKDSLFQLQEGLEWRLFRDEFVDHQKTVLYEKALQHLCTHKNLCLELARHHGVSDHYIREILKGGSSGGSSRDSATTPFTNAATTAAKASKSAPYTYNTVSDYEGIGELRYALLVWRSDLQRDVSLLHNNEEREIRLEGGYMEALKLISRCIKSSAAYWSTQRHRDAPVHEDASRVGGMAAEKVKLVVRYLSEEYGIEKEIGALEGLAKLPSTDTIV
jgi:hypothetical protein